MTTLKSRRICSKHFVSGKPADLYDETNPDWLPTCYLGHQKKKPASTDRFERRMKRTAAKDNTNDSERMDEAITIPFEAALEEYSYLENIATEHQPNKAAELRDDIVLQENTNCRRTVLEEGSLLDKDMGSEQMDDEERLHFVQHKLSRVERNSGASPELEEASEDIALHATAQTQCCIVDRAAQTTITSSDRAIQTASDIETQTAIASGDKATQTAITSGDISALFAGNFANCLAQYTHIPPFSESYLDQCDVTFYTGLPNIKIVKAVFNHVLPAITQSAFSKLTAFQEFMMTMLKLRLNCQLQDLAQRFSVSPSTVSRIILKWLKALYARLKKLIIWPDREALKKTMPVCFQAAFGSKVAVIIDCFEIFIDRPSNLQARAYTWSTYKHHNTAKVLIGITPQGVVSFISKAWGGRASDKYITEHCKLLDHLIPGDVVLADRGFNIAESVGVMQAQLHIPAFTKNRSQLSALEIEQTRTVANVRIHIERVIGNIRKKYSILQSTLPIDFLVKRTDEDKPLIDYIITVCCALCNVCDSVVPVN